MWKEHKYVQVKEHPTEEWMESQEINEELKNTWKQMKMKTQVFNTFGTNKGGLKMEVHSTTSLSQETIRVSNKQPILKPKWPAGKIANKP